MGLWLQDYMQLNFFYRQKTQSQLPNSTLECIANLQSLPKTVKYGYEGFNPKPIHSQMNTVYFNNKT